MKGARSVPKNGLLNYLVGLMALTDVDNLGSDLPNGMNPGPIEWPLPTQIPLIFFFSSRAHSISHFWPVELSEFLLTSTMTPSERFIRVRTFSFQALS
jgi:hypothetical protein